MTAAPRDDRRYDWSETGCAPVLAGAAGVVITLIVAATLIALGLVELALFVARWVMEWSR